MWREERISPIHCTSAIRPPQWHHIEHCPWLWLCSSYLQGVFKVGEFIEEVSIEEALIS